MGQMSKWTLDPHYSMISKTHMHYLTRTIIESTHALTRIIISSVSDIIVQIMTTLRWTVKTHAPFVCLPTQGLGKRLAHLLTRSGCLFTQSGSTVGLWHAGWIHSVNILLAKEHCHFDRPRSRSCGTSASCVIQIQDVWYWYGHS